MKFDKFEDEDPTIENQHFYGFKDVSPCSDYNDATFMREKVASDLYVDFGVLAVKTAY